MAGLFEQFYALCKYNSRANPDPFHLYCGIRIPFEVKSRIRILIKIIVIVGSGSECDPKKPYTKILSILKNIIRIQPFWKPDLDPTKSTGSATCTISSLNNEVDLLKYRSTEGRSSLIIVRKKNRLFLNSDSVEETKFLKIHSSIWESPIWDGSKENRGEIIFCQIFYPLWKSMREVFPDLSEKKG